MKARPFHHQRPLAACAALYGAGVVLGVYFPWQPRLVLSGLVLCLLAAVVLRRLQKRAVLGWMGAFLFMGLFLSGRIAHKPLPAYEKCPIEGIVAEEVVLRPDGTAQGYLEQVVMEGEKGNISLGTVYWTYYPDAENFLLPTDGQRVRFIGKVYQPARQDNPFGFDFRLFLLEKGIHVGVSGAKDLAILGQESRGISTFLYRCRSYLSQRLENVFQSASALPRALLLGEKARLPQEVQDSFSKAGVAHILSVSGLHVSMLSYCVMKLIPKRCSGKLRFLVMGLFLFVYCGMLGFPAPAVRAAVFMLLNAYRRMVWRGRDWLTVVSAAFLLILLQNPMALFSGSFQLSFGAVLGIFLVLPKLEKKCRRLKKTALGSNLLVTLSASVGLLLPSVQLFHSVSIIGLILNPFVCVLFMALLPVYGVLLGLGCIWLEAAQTLAVPIHILTTAVEAFVLWAGQLPFVQLPVPQLPWYVAAAVLGAFLLVSGFVVLGKKRGRQLAAGALVICSVAVWQCTACRDVQYIQFSVGQADAAVVLDGKETVVIDAGEYGGDVAAFLRSTGRRADTLVITHLHKDHCLGVEQLLENGVVIRRVIVPHQAFFALADGDSLRVMERLRDLNVPVYAMHAGEYFETARCRFTALWPMENAVVPGQNANRYCLSLLCEMDGVRLLHASDLEGNYELYAARDADLLKVAHHGSRDATREAFLQQVTPAAALISAGYSDALPHEDTLARLEKYGVSVYNTGERGAITVTCRKGVAEIAPYLPIQQEMP